MRNIYLIGFMGVGKTAVSKALSTLTESETVDTDELIFHREKRTIPEIFEKEGEAYFRRVETEVFQDISTRKDLIVSCGGGAATLPENVELMKASGTVVLLRATPQTVLKRVEHDENRPLLKDKKNIKDIEALMEKRRAAYESAADLIVETDDKTPNAIASEIMASVDF